MAKKLMKIEGTISVPATIKLDPAKLLKYADEIRKRFDAEPGELETVSTLDLLSQAEIDGDIEIPENFHVDYDEAFSDDELRAIQEGKG